jgi:hypothetical protein
MEEKEQVRRDPKHSQTVVNLRLWFNTHLQGVVFGVESRLPGDYL